jgi:tRNA(Ile)-lysidine synthase TilS/MesJ
MRDWTPEEVARAAGARVVLTAHTQEDQAETLLLALVRGSGAEGLGGMRAVRALDEDEPRVLLARPLLGWARRAETAAYCQARGVEVRADAMNEDERFARVRVRRRLLPLLTEFNPRVIAALARTAELLRADARALDAQAALLLAAARADGAGQRKRNGEAGQRAPNESAPEADALCAWPLRVAVLRGADEAVRRRALRLWLKAGRGDLRRLTRAHVRGVERLLVGERGRRVAELPGGARIERRRGLLIFKDRDG